MAHFAKISEENIVLTVLTLNNEDCMDEEGNEVESIGQAYLEKHKMLHQLLGNHQLVMLRH